MKLKYGRDEKKVRNIKLKYRKGEKKVRKDKRKNGGKVNRMECEVSFLSIKNI